MAFERKNNIYCTFNNIKKCNNIKNNANLRPNITILTKPDDPSLQ